MEIKTKVITLGAREKGEADKLVTFFSLDHGVISATVKGVRKAGAKLSSCTFSFAFSEVVLAEKSGFYTVTACDTLEPFFEISANIETFEYASACLELTQKLLHGNIETQPVFILLLQTLKSMCYGHGNIKIIFLNYLFDMISIAGYKINLTLANKLIQEKGHCYINLESGQIISACSIDMNVAKIDKDTLIMLQDLSNVSSSDLEMLSIKYKQNKVIDLTFVWAKVLCENLMGYKFKSFLTIDL